MIKNNNEKLVKQIYAKIKKYKKVTLFGHMNLDNDSYGACLGMALFLKNMGIEAKIAGVETITNKSVLKEVNDEFSNPSEEFIKSSLAIVLDLGCKKNLVTNQFDLCKESVRIDHHPYKETFCDIEWVDINYCSTCEMVGWFILFNNPKMMSKSIANALYVGILTDSGNLLFPSATCSAYDLVSKFFIYDFDKQEKQNQILLRNWDDVIVNAKLTKKIKIINDEIAYLVLKPKTIKKYNLDDGDSKVYLMSQINQFKVWFSVYYSEQRKSWKCSIRSREYDVSSIACKYNGGGHKLASGLTLNSLKELNNLIQDVKELIKK